MNAVRYISLLFFFAGSVHAQSLDVITPKKSTSLSLQDMKGKLKSFSVRIDDPVYKAIKQFDAFELKDVLELAGAEAGENADEIVFGTVDGYSPNIPFAVIKQHKAFVAYQEKGMPGRFSLVNQGKAKLSPWPFYLVWEEGIKTGAEVPWPYQLIKIEVVDWKQKYPLVVPDGAAPNSAERRGFAIFKAECIRCHSINLQGGDVGPELNAPQNVTEYWKTDTLKAFISDATSFRYKSKMPPFPKLKSEQIGDLVSYLKFMKDRKIKKP